ncbi:MAG: NUDIX hydrolase [Candidatus Omnitrophica bacterium]|nr:NUDIX hydrolase [Candidatus Omnitrophota bacterium]
MRKQKLIYKGRILRLIKKQQRLPNGYLADFEMIGHPGASLVVPFLTRDKIILLKQFRPVIGAYLYELPAGTLQDGETPLNCARREIAEETGYSASKFTGLGRIYPVPGYSTEKIFIYKAEKLQKCESRTEEDEVIKSFPVTRALVKKLFLSGKITDAKTICALAKCGWL